jgi:cellulose synthase/poly-beta-1,6-N-acetylglucosamine synthase-like glycosyltransferase
LTQSLQHALLVSSPRFESPPTPLPSILIHATVFLLWIGTFACAFIFGGALAWSAGITYVAYDTLLLGFVFLQTLRLAGLRSAMPSGCERTSLGVIIAAHNEAVVLPTTLGALLSQSDPADAIIVADDGSTDATAELLVAQYGLKAPALGELSQPSTEHPALRWLRLSHQGKGSALNAAVLAIQTDTVVTVDGDTLLEHTALAAVREAFSSEAELVAATGILMPVCSDSLKGRVFQWFQTYEYIRNFLSRYAWMQLDSLLLISGAFAGFRRTALLEVGGFDNDCLVEDYELIHRLRRYGDLHGRCWTTRVLGGARARTEAPGTIGSFLRQRRRWFGGFLQTQYWYRDMVGDRRYGWLGTLMLPIKAIDTLQPIYGLTALVVLLGSLATGRFSIVVPVSAIILGKIAIDLAFHLWSVQIYRIWVGEQTNARLGWAFLAALAEPFSFQILRHLGAAWGWLIFMTGRKTWGKQVRVGVVDSFEAE